MHYTACLGGNAFVIYSTTLSPRPGQLLSRYPWYNAPSATAVLPFIPDTPQYLPNILRYIFLQTYTHSHLLNPWYLRILCGHSLIRKTIILNCTQYDFPKQSLRGEFTYGVLFPTVSGSCLHSLIHRAFELIG